jgi:hypothetical protein
MFSIGSHLASSRRPIREVVRAAQHHTRLPGPKKWGLLPGLGQNQKFIGRFQVDHENFMGLNED